MRPKEASLFPHFIDGDGRATGNFILVLRHRIRLRKYRQPGHCLRVSHGGPEAAAFDWRARALTLILGSGGVAALAAAYPDPVVLTSDPEDLTVVAEGPQPVTIVRV